MRWSELPPARLEIELAKLGITVDDLVGDAQDVPEIQPWFENLTSDDARRTVAIEYFGDQGRPQPTERSEWLGSGRTPDWGRLPRLEGDTHAPAKQPDKPKKPRYRPPDEIPKATIKQLMLELAQRKARPKDPELTQEKIANRVELHPTRVQQAEALESVGWPLLRSHPDFSVDDRFVRWPSAKKAAQVLASEPAEN